ncbi:MAG: hypothetical protein IJI35_14005 [Kiritimatiellae bacterium]|nr:hypothetical protein [Kiritimatiellia bacterium]
MKLLKDGKGSRGAIVAALTVMGAIAATSAIADEPVTAWADATTAVDACDFRAALGTATLRCSPKWCTDAEGAEYSLSVVTDPDTANAATSSVPVSAATVEGDVAYVGSGYVRFILKASVGGVETGDTLVQDVSFGLASAPGAAIVADSRAVSLQEAINASGAANVVYSSDWAEGAAAVSVAEIALAGRGGEAIATNSVFFASAVADGTVPVGGLDTGWYRLLYRAVDGNGETLLEYLTDEFRVKGGIMLLVK